MLKQVQETQDRTTILFDRLDDVHQMVHELARIILPSFGEFTSVWEITHNVLEHYRCRPKAA